MKLLQFFVDVVTVFVFLGVFFGESKCSEYGV